MKPEELMIDNIIFIPKTKQTATITGINKHIGVLVNNNIIGGLGFTEIEPVELTEEFLLKNGAEKKSIGVVYGRFRLRYYENYKYWYVTDLETKAYITKVEFIHEWQNMLYSTHQQDKKFNI